MARRAAEEALVIETSAGKMTLAEALDRDDPEGTVTVTVSAHLLAEFMEHGAGRIVDAEVERRTFSGSDPSPSYGLDD